MVWASEFARPEFAEENHRPPGPETGALARLRLPNSCCRPRGSCLHDYSSPFPFGSIMRIGRS
jgi:hypothetical protein